MPKVTTIPPRKQRNHAVASQETRKIRVAAYCRVSTDTEEQATSYQAQIAHYEEVIHRNPEWVFAGIYADDGISATSTKHREQFHQMIQDCMDGKIDLIITQKVSNVSRDAQEMTICARMLAARKPPVGIYFISEDLYTLASYYRDDLREPCFFPTPDWKILPDDELDMRGALHE